MNNKVLNEIKEFAVSKLNATYGYCGVAESDTFLMINSDDKKRQRHNNKDNNKS